MGIWICLVDYVATQGVDAMMENGWSFQRPCEVGIFPLMVALNMIAKRIVEEAVKQEETGGKLENGKTYARTGKLLRVYDQAQEYLLDSLKNKRFCGKCSTDQKE